MCPRLVRREAGRKQRAKHLCHHPNHEGGQEDKQENENENQQSVNDKFSHDNLHKVGAGPGIEPGASQDESDMFPLHHPDRLKVHNQKSDCR